MKIRKRHVDWQRFLCGIPAGDYVFQDEPYELQIQRAKGYSLIRLNMDEAVVPESFGNRAIGIGGDMAKAISDLKR